MKLTVKVNEGMWKDGGQLWMLMVEQPWGRKLWARLDWEQCFTGSIRGSMPGRILIVFDAEPRRQH